MTANKRVDVELSAKTKQELMSAGQEVVLGNCGGFLSTGGTGDEFMLGSGFKQSSEFLNHLSKKQEEYY